MKKYFGTDGIRGVANLDLSPKLCFQLGRILGTIARQNKDDEITVLIGRDTRISGEMLESALVAGLLSAGANVMRLGVITTPGVAYLTRALNATYGIMISASHNPYYDNGIKIFGSDGYKLTDEMELEIERLLDDEKAELYQPTHDGIGRVDEYFEGIHKYLLSIQKSVPQHFDQLKVAIDCANGSTSNLAPHLFANLEANALFINNEPDGTNINVNCGSTSIESLRQFVRENDVDLGLAFDGDGDRLIAVDEHGEVVNGDKIMYIIAKHLKEKGALKHDMVVTTVMSNLGLYKALDKIGIQSVKTPVGDRYVLEEMLKNGYNLGGEQSGHIIMLDHATSGDGLLTAVQLIHVMLEKDASLSELASEVVEYPQVLRNVAVMDKEKVIQHPALLEKIKAIEAKLGSDGRVLVRPSGTEELIRVMVEAPTEELANQYVQEIQETIETIKRD